MSRPKEIRKKVDVSRSAAPLQTNPFAVLGELDALKNLAPGPEEEKQEKKVVHGPDASPSPPRKKRGRLVLRRETKDRGGKVVVVISGFAELPGANAVMIANLAKELKGKLGCGGSFDRQEIVLQGDRCAATWALLQELGFTVAGVRE
ncbi:MAG TPA: translation initiation factor [Candidatus Methylacidiphilales bacterium]|nr:translation initiation factor [Candidatus Methylacidiphilales bacterium]